MAVDVKTLRIGSHVDFNGRRVRIKAIVEDSVAFDYTQDEKQLYLSPNAYDEFILPIPITPELLKELGFEQDMRFAYGKAFKMECGEMWIGASAMSKGFWRVEAMDDTYNYGNCVIRYLHEAEAFLVLHGVELIKD